MSFRTKLDYSNNRQIKQREQTFTNLSGGTVFGLPFSGLSSGVDITNTGTTEENINISGNTFSGNGTTTIFAWSDSRISIVDDYLSALTPSNSGITQNSGNIFTSSSTTIIDGNTVNLTYSGVSIEGLSVVEMVEISPSIYTGRTTIDYFNVLSGGSIDYTGRTIWIDNPEITRTNRLIITENPQPGYVWTCSDSEGMGYWGVGVSADTFTTGSTLIGSTLYFNRNDALSAYTVDLSSLLDDTNSYTTGTTIINDIAYFNRNDSLSAYTLDLSAYVNVDTFITGLTFNSSNYQITASRNDGFTTTPIDLSILSADVTITGGTYDINTGIVTFTNNSGGTFNVSGFTSGMTDSFTIAANISGNSITFDSNLNGPNFYNVDLTPILSGITLASGNGITIGTGNTVNLGGSLNQPTVISGNSQTFDLGVTGSELSFLRIKSVQAQEDYKFAGEGLQVIKNPGAFQAELDYTSSLGRKTTIQQSQTSISTFTSSNSGNTTSQIIQTPGVINILTNTDNTTLSESGLVLDQPSDSFSFVDNRLAPRGLEYDADYSSGYTPLSLITYGDLTGYTSYVHPNHTGDVTSVGDGATTITNDAVTNAKLSNMAQATIKGRANGAGTGDPSDLSASEVLEIIKNVDGTGSGLDADLLDGLHATNFVKTSTEITTNLDTYYTAGMVGFNNTTTGAPYVGFGQVLCIVNLGDVHNNTNNWITQLAFGTNQTSSYFRTKVNNGAWGAWQTIWNSSNDGAGSGLDADLLDGVQGANYLQKSSDFLYKTITIESPTASEDITIFRTNVAITVQEVIAVSVGTTPSTTYQLKHSTDRNAAGNNLTTSAASTSTTTGNVATLSDNTIPADSWVWLETTAASGTNVKLTIDIRYTID